MANEFLKREIRAIARRTDRNYHGENMEFIAKKINSPLLKEFKAINKYHKKAGFLSHDVWTRRHNKFTKLMEELKRKNPSQYEEISGGL